jgi:hypothetical protein
MTKIRSGVLAALLATLVTAPVMAQTDVTPNLGATVPASWSTDRYAPCQFGLANGVNGRDNVAQLSVCAQDSQANRLAPFNDSFYNYQGMKIGIDPTGVTPPLSQIFQLDLYVDQSWSSLGNGLVAPSMWSRVNMIASNDESTAWYPILGFSNGSGSGEFRYWDSNLGWQDLAATVNYGAWNSLAIEYTGNVFTAFVNGTAQYTEVADAGVSRVSDVFLESYNQTGTPYTADWSQHAVTATPEPASLGLFATGFIGLGGAGWMKKRRRKTAAAE